MRDKVQSSVSPAPGGRQECCSGGAGAKKWQDAAGKSNGLWRSSFTKKVFLASIFAVACMLVFKAKEAVWCLSNDCGIGIGGVGGLDLSVMQKAIDLQRRSRAPVRGEVRSEGEESSGEHALAPLLPPSSVLEGGLEHGCRGAADCPGEKLCVQEACVCPVLFSGDSLCESPTPGMAAGCITPITSRRLPLFAQQRNISLPERTLQTKSSSAGNARIFWSNIQDITDFSTCAVVGSSSSVLRDSGRSLGTEIDEHTVVIRFNDAPTQGFEKWVGSRTTLRIQNVIYCGFREHPSEFCFRYTSKERKNGHIEMSAKNAFHCRPINGTSEMLLYAMAYWQLSSIVVEHDAYDQPAVPWDKSLRKMSAGFFGIALAAHLCGKVDVYGVESGELHYYVKRPNLKHKAKSQSQSQCTLAGCKSKRTFSQRHSWNQESKCLGHIRQGGLPRLNMRT